MRSTRRPHGPPGTSGSSTVTAAILDSGIDYDNFDLNGVVDLSRSTSFVPTDDALLAALFPTRNPLDDLVGHGMLTSALVASNGLVFAGVTSRTRLIGVKVLGATGGTLGSVLAGIVWAADHGADVANLSIGFRVASTRRRRAVCRGHQPRDSYANRAGMLLVVAPVTRHSSPRRRWPEFVSVLRIDARFCVSATGPTAGADPVTSFVDERRRAS